MDQEWSTHKTRLNTQWPSNTNSKLKQKEVFVAVRTPDFHLSNKWSSNDGN